MVTVTTDCQHGMPTPASCLSCMEGPVVDPRDTKPQADRIASTFEARFEGQCPTCDLPVYPGQIVHRLEPSGAYVHAFSGCEPC